MAKESSKAHVVEVTQKVLLMADGHSEIGL